MWQDKMIAEGRLELLQKSLRAKACADIGKPKHPASPFIHFLTSQAKADQPRSIVCKAAGETWRKLSDAEKKKYNPNYAAEMRDY
uniref:HMG box domain-containing protein n=1 Tax=Plectus sambesii TaxID=2011161 RepID=A0A914UU48_9BILA